MNPPKPPSVFKWGTRYEPAKAAKSRIDGNQVDLAGNATKLGSSWPFVSSVQKKLQRGKKVVNCLINGSNGIMPISCTGYKLDKQYISFLRWVIGHEMQRAHKGLESRWAAMPHLCLKCLILRVMGEGVQRYVVRIR